MLKFDYHLNSQALLRLNQFKDLGFIYVPSFDFHPCIDFTTSKALRVLGFVRKYSTSFDNPKCLSTLYSTLIRSILGYGDIVRSPLYYKQYMVS